MKKKATWILILMLLILLVGADTLCRKLAAKQADSQLQAEIESTMTVESPATEGQDSIISKAGAESTTGESSEALTAASDFTVQKADGTVRELSEHKGKPIVLNLWTSWCSPCRAKTSELNEVYKEHGTEVQFLMINLTSGNRKTVGSASDFVTTQDYGLLVLYDAAQNAARTYDMFSIPCTYFIDANGMITAQARGAINKDILLYGIEMITMK